MRYCLLFLLCTVFTGERLLGQQDGLPATEGDLLVKLKSGYPDQRVHLELDSLLEANYYKLMVQNQDRTGIPGYRIRIFSESGVNAKEEQQRVRARFLSLYPDVDAYYYYDEPYFKVYVGDCRTMSLALKLDDRIRRNFPNTIIVPDDIRPDE